MIPDSVSSDSAPPIHGAVPSSVALATRLSQLSGRLSQLSGKEPYPDCVPEIREFNWQFYNINAKPLDLRWAKTPIYLDHCRRSNAAGDSLTLTRGVQFDPSASSGPARLTVRAATEPVVVQSNASPNPGRFSVKRCVSEARR